MEENKRGVLTTRQYWDKVWHKERKEDRYMENLKCWKEVFSLIKVSRSKKLKFIELGVGGSGELLVLLKSILDVELYGVDISKKGLDDVKRNLEKEKIKIKLIHSDILDENFLRTYKEKFDIVLSNGLIEHFSGKYLKKVIQAHFVLAKERGTVIIAVPNFSSPLYKFLGAIFSPRTTFKHHNLAICNTAQLKKNLSPFGKVELLMYCGKLFEPNIICGVSFINFWLSQLNKISSFIRKEVISPRIVIVVKKINKKPYSRHKE